MQINETGLAIIRESEGLSLRAYRCPAGVLTIGYGHTGPEVRADLTITREQAHFWLLKDVAAAEAAIFRLVRAPLNENQFSALVSFYFNVGHGRAGAKDGFAVLRNGRPSSMLTLLNAYRYHASAQQFDRWIYAKGVELPGLKTRRAREKALFLKPVIVNPPTRKEP